MSGGLSTAQAKALLEQVWPTAAPGKAPPISTPAKHAILALWRHETGYGSWSGPMLNSHNLGAMQCPNTGSDCSPEAQRGKDCALWSDTDGTGEASRKPQCFRVFPDWPTAILASLQSISPNQRPLTSAALATGNLSVIADAMHTETYFAKKGSVTEYAAALWKNAQAMAPQLGEPLAVFLSTPPPASPVDGHVLPAGLVTEQPSSDEGELVALGLGLAGLFFLGRRAAR